MSTLSNSDIQKELVNGKILIFPFNKKNLKGASYNLTASKIAYKIPKDQNDAWKSAYNSLNDKVIIEGKSTVLIVTNETIYVNKNIAGTYHSKVRLVSKGLSHVSTTLDPGYLGVSVIALHNHTDQNIELIPEQDTFISLIFRYLKTESSVEHDNTPGRSDILPQLNQDESDWFYKDFRTNPRNLQEKLENESTDFQEIKKKYQARRRRLSVLIPYIVYLSLVIASSGIAGVLSTNRNQFKQESWWYSTINYLVDKATPVFWAALAVQLVNDIQKNR